MSALEPSSETRQREMPGARPDFLLVIILTLALIRGVLYASVVPPWQTPDEPKHFEYVALLEEKGRLIGYEDADPILQREIITSMRSHDFWRFGYANGPEATSRSFQDIWKDSPTQLHRPPLYYLIVTPFHRLALDMSIDFQLYVVRLVSVVLGVLTVLMVFLAVRTIFPTDRLVPLAAAGFVAFLPTHTFVTGSANSDNLANLLAAGLAYTMARVFREGSSAARILGILALMAAGIWTKRTTAFSLPLMVLAGPLYLIGGRLRRSIWAVLGGGVLAMATLAAAAAASDGVKNSLQWVLDRYVFNYSAASSLARFQESGYGIEDVIERHSGLSLRMLDSFWAQFGWMNVRLDGIWYDFLGVLGLLSVVGLLLWVVRLTIGRERVAVWQVKILGLYVLWIVLIVSITLMQYTLEYSGPSYPQGRYLFPAIVPIAALFILGIKNLSPKGLQPLILCATVAAFFLVDSLSLVFYILPFYYQPL